MACRGFGGDYVSARRSSLTALRRLALGLAGRDQVSGTLPDLPACARLGLFPAVQTSKSPLDFSMRAFFDLVAGAGFEPAAFRL
jgi:hypothetical protein